MKQPHGLRLSQQAKEQLIRLKAITGMSHWNELCRVAFAVSLSEATPVAGAAPPSDSNLEMAWKVFAGSLEGAIWPVICHRARREGIEVTESSIAEYVRAHIHRGIGYLIATQSRSLPQLIDKIFDSQTTKDLGGKPGKPSVELLPSIGH